MYYEYFDALENNITVLNCFSEKLDTFKIEPCGFYPIIIYCII